MSPSGRWPFIYVQPLCWNSAANLWFTNVQTSDQLDAGTYYVCVLVNDILRATTAGLDSNINVQRSSTVSYPVTTLYNSPNFVTGTVNRSTEMKCIFGGQCAQRLSVRVRRQRRSALSVFAGRRRSSSG